MTSLKFEGLPDLTSREGKESGKVHWKYPLVVVVVGSSRSSNSSGSRSSTSRSSIGDIQ